MRGSAFSGEVSFAGGGVVGFEAPRRAAVPPAAMVVAAAALLVAYLAGGVFGVAPGGAVTRTVPRVRGLVSTRARARGATGGADGPDVAGVVEAVSHQVVADVGHPAELVAHDDAYTARFARSGFTLAPTGAAHAFSWSLTRAGRDGARSDVAALGWHATANVATRTVRDAVTERVTARDGHVEWDLVLGRRPAGTGAFVVDAAVGHADAVALGAFRVRDASGTVVWRARARVVDGHVSVRIPSPLLEHARYPLTIDPSVTPEVFVAPVPAKQNQSTPAVAFDGTNYLVVWTDGRSGTDADVYGARVTKAGTVLDPAGIPISTAPNNQVAPAVAFDGTHFIVVWGDIRSGTDYDIYGTRVSTAGAVLDPSGIPISTAAHDQDGPKVAFDGTNALVVWVDRRSDTSDDIYGARLTTAGTVLDPNGIPISTAIEDQGQPALGFDGTHYFVAWYDVRTSIKGEVYGARVSSAGTVLDPSGIPISTGPNGKGQPAVVFDGTDDLVVWADARSVTTADIYGARVSSAGTVLDPSGIPISTAANNQFWPAVAFDGTNALVAWEDHRSVTTADVYGARVSPAGSVLDPSGIPIATAAKDQGDAVVGFDGTNYLVGWTDQTSTALADVYGARVSTSGTVLDPGGFRLSTMAGNQLGAAVAFDGTNYLIVWDDRRSGTDTILGARVSKTGALLDPGGIAVFSAGASNQEFHPSVAFDGTNYLVVWDDSSPTTVSNDIYGSLISTSGALVVPNVIHISTAADSQIAPVVAFDGTNYLVVWEDRRSGTNHDIYGARVNQTGTVLEPAGIAISTAAGEQVTSAVAFDGSNFVVVWEDHRSGTNVDIYGARLAGGATGTGLVLDPAGIPISTAANDQLGPKVASDGTNSLVVWSDNRSGTSRDIYGTRVSNTGTVLSPAGTPLSTAPNDQSQPAVAFNGAYLVIWNDRRAGTRTDVYGARVGTDGAVQDASGFAVATDTVTNEQLAATKGDGAKWGVTYARAIGSGTNIFTRTVAPK